MVPVSMTRSLSILSHSPFFFIIFFILFPSFLHFTMKEAFLPDGQLLLRHSFLMIIISLPLFSYIRLFAMLPLIIVFFLFSLSLPFFFSTSLSLPLFLLLLLRLHMMMIKARRKEQRRKSWKEGKRATGMDHGISISHKLRNVQIASYHALKRTILRINQRRRKEAERKKGGREEERNKWVSEGNG